MVTVLRRLAGTGAILFVLAAGLGGTAAAAQAAPRAAGATCSGPPVVSMPNQTVTEDALADHDDLSCADFAGANLAGLDLELKDLSGADLQGADLTGTKLADAKLDDANLAGAHAEGVELTQAELSGANLTGADLQNAHLDQATLDGADLTGADLRHADLTQADLTNAKLTNAKLGGADLTEAETSGTDFSGSTGSPPYATYVLIGAGVIFVLLVATALRRRRAFTRFLLSIPGSAIVALGLHMFVGGIIGDALTATSPQQLAGCSGPQCGLGLTGGFWVTFFGLPVVLLGFAVRAFALGMPGRINRRFAGGPAAMGTGLLGGPTGTPYGTYPAAPYGTYPGGPAAPYPGVATGSYPGVLPTTTTPPPVPFATITPLDEV